MNFQIFKLNSEKAEEPETKLPTSVGSSKKSKRVPEKNIYFHFIDYATSTLLTVWITTNCETFKKWEYQMT